jgi:hypothetical protein
MEAVTRRAALLHELLLKHHPGLRHSGTEELAIDEKVLQAFLYVPEYKHGARSMETLIMCSRLEDAERFGPSCLPPKEQLTGHVDTDAFDEFLRGRVQHAETALKALADRAMESEFDRRRPRDE